MLFTTSIYSFFPFVCHSRLTHSLRALRMLFRPRQRSMHCYYCRDHLSSSTTTTTTTIYVASWSSSRHLAFGSEGLEFKSWLHQVDNESFDKALCMHFLFALRCTYLLKTEILSVFIQIFLPSEFGKILIFSPKIRQNTDFSPGMGKGFLYILFRHTEFFPKILIFLVIYTAFES